MSTSLTGLRVYVIDQDEQQEYAGRFCDYLGGSRVPIKTVDDAEAAHQGQVTTHQGVRLWAESN